MVKQNSKIDVSIALTSKYAGRLDVPMSRTLSSLAVNADRRIGPIEEKTDELFYSHSDSHNANELPLSSHRQQLQRMIKEYKVTLVVGETGSGKSTLLPQFLLDDPKWLGICVAEPRRMAAVNLSSYVCTQRGCQLGEDDIGYAIRFEQKANERTRLLFVTVGLLLRQFLFDPLLERYQLVMLDEVHERSIDMDVAIALLKKVLKKRSDFRVVLASATPDIQQIKAFFGNDLAIINITGRQYPVSIYHVIRYSSNVSTHF